MSVDLVLIEPAETAIHARVRVAAATAGLDLLAVDPAAAPNLSEFRRGPVLLGPDLSQPLQMVRTLGLTGPQYRLVLLLRRAAALDELRAELVRDPFLPAPAEVLDAASIVDLPVHLRRLVDAARESPPPQSVPPVTRARATNELAHRRQRAGAAPARAHADAYLASILANAPLAIITTDLASRILSWNPVASALFRIPADVASGQSLALLSPLQPRGMTLADAAQRVLQTSEAEHREIACRLGTGRVAEISASLAPSRDEGGTLLGLSILARDTAQQRRMEESFRDVNRQRDEFLAVMSHELRTPLTSIIGYTDMLLRGVSGQLPPRTSTYLSNVRAASGRLLDLVNGLLDFARLESGKELLQLREVDPLQVTSTAIRQARLQADAKHIQLEGPAGPRHRTVLADPVKLEHTLLHLLSNAVKFTAPGGRIWVEVDRAPDAPDQVRFSVRDTGVGLSPDQADRVWDRFYQVDPSLTRPQGGLGLGLSISRQLVRLHGGDVGVVSPGPGRGTTFWFTIPSRDRLARSEAR